VRPAPGVWVVGYAVSDLVRLVAELLDNAAVYSAPDTYVTVTSHQAPDRRVVIEIADRGIGMGEAALADANARLTEGALMGATASRQMGLFVVGRLARKHGVHVRLQRADGGVTAVVTVPEELLASRPALTESDDSGSGTDPAAGVGWFDDAPPFEEDDDVDPPKWPQSPPDEESGQPRQPAGGRSPARAAEGEKAARKVAEPQSDGQTSAGLPRRKPRENLVSGSARPAQASRPLNGASDDSRHRVTGFQTGTNEAHGELPRRAEHRTSEPERRYR
jgi:anti-sigma regulatory factor (Ser/Thr protein kinase)